MKQEVDFPTLKRHVPYAQHQIVDVTFGAAHTDTEIKHILLPPTPEHIDYQVIRQAQAGQVYHDMTGERVPWREGVVRLRSDVANARVTLLLTVSHEKRTLIEAGPASTVPATPSHTHDAADTVSGEFAVARIPDLDGSIITSGEVDEAFIPSLGRPKLPSEIAYEDEANVFTANQAINKTRPELTLLTSGTAKGRIGQHAANRVLLSHNLSFNGSAWQRDDTGAVGAALEVESSDGINFYTAAAGANPATLTRQVRVSRTGQIFERERTVAMGEWTTWTPTWTNVTVGNGDVTARYSHIGKTVHFTLQLIFGSMTAVTGLIGFSPPINNKAASASEVYGVGVAYDATDGSRRPLIIISGSAILMRVQSGEHPAVSTSSVSPITWATGDQLYLRGTYEEA